MGFRMFIVKAIIFVVLLFNGTLISFLAAELSDYLEIFKELIRQDEDAQEPEFIDNDDDEITELEKRFGPIRLTPKNKK